MQNQNKRQKAVALSYNPEDTAPKVVASGEGQVAERIMDIARESDVPLHQDEKLANALSGVEVGDCIPPELYEVVAEVLVFVDNMDKIKGKIDTDRGRGR